jgi:hypothetical protein
VAGDPRPIIANRAEAWLGVLGRLLAVAGVVIIALRQPIGGLVLLAGIVILVGYLRRVGQRIQIDRNDRHYLRMWLGTGALYQSLRVIRSGPGASR